MFSFYPSHPRALSYSQYSRPAYSVYPDDDLYSPYLSSPDSRRLLITNPEVRYRRALDEYLAAEEEYNTVLRAREEAKLRMAARAEAIRQARQERARLRVTAQLARARREQQARQFKQGLARALARAAVSGDDDLSLHQVVQQRSSERPLFDLVIPSSCMDGHASYMNRTSVEKEKMEERDETRVKQCPVSTSEPGEPNLESVLRERLQKIAGDEEVQDLARSILRHVSSATGVSPCGVGSCPEVNISSTQPDEGADLSRCHALKGAAAEAAKTSFKAHRAEAVEKSGSSPTSPTARTPLSSLLIIEDIRSALTRLSDGFSLPPSLDFSDDEPDGLAHTPANAPVRVYEHALNQLLEHLDAVESDGDEEVRVVRRAAVKEVEKKIEDVETNIRKARETASQAGSAVSTEGKKLNGATNENISVANDKSGAEVPSLMSGGRVDSAPSRPEILGIPNAEVAVANAAKPTESKSVQDGAIVKGQSSTPPSGSVDPSVAVASHSPAHTDHIEVIVSNDDVSDSKHGSEVFDEQATTDEITPVRLGSEVSITRADSPVEISVPMVGAIAPSPTPVGPLMSSIVPDELPASLSWDGLSVSAGEDDAELDDADGEGEWTEI